METIFYYVSYVPFFLRFVPKSWKSFVHKKSLLIFYIVEYSGLFYESLFLSFIALLLQIFSYLKS